MSALPVVFVSHGSPALAAHPGDVGRAWQELAARWPTPSAIVCISAHWLSERLSVTAAEQPGQIFDFYGFPRELYQKRYLPYGAPQVAQAIVERLAEFGFEARLEPVRGLDHGTWVPLLSMYPLADVPVLQLSLLKSDDPLVHHRVGEALSALSAQGILLLGSGGLTHNLSYFGFIDEQGPVLPFVASFRQWLHDRLRARQWEQVLAYQQQAPEAKANHPSSEHLHPLFICMGAGGPDSTVEILDLGVQYGMLAMDAVVFQPGPIL